MRRSSLEHMNCSVAQTLEIVGDWWSLLIVRDAFFGASRFGDFQRSLGIARNILTERLDWLCDHEVLERRIYQERPPRYEYVLTEKGRDLQTVLLAMLAWGDRWTSTAGKPPVIATEGGADPVELRIVNTRTGLPVRPRRVRMRPGPGAGDAETTVRG